MQPSRSIEEREGLCTMFTWGIYKLGTPSALSRQRIGVAVSSLLRNLREPEAALPKN